MIHFVISDTHAPHCLAKAVGFIQKKIGPEVDAIVINGDLLGIFSMQSSNIHKKYPLTDEAKQQYLKQAAPIFASKYTGQMTDQLAIEYIAERYQWMLKVLQQLSTIRTTIFNMGNHESPRHFLVMREIGFLTGHMVDPGLEPLNRIFQWFEEQLLELETQGNFHYIRNKPLMIGNTLILGIPGESHATQGEDFDSSVQEDKTKELIALAKPMLTQVYSLIIYNHTQGEYNNETGEFNTASQALKHFMENLPANISTKVFVQSHNHWSHTQHILSNGFNFVLNNAGLHDGIFNRIDFNLMNVTVYDADPNSLRLTRLNPIKPPLSEQQRIMKLYPDPNYVMNRRNLVYAQPAAEQVNIKSKIFG